MSEAPLTTNTARRTLDGQQSLFAEVPTVRRCRRCGRPLLGAQARHHGIGRTCRQRETAERAARPLKQQRLFAMPPKPRRKRRHLMHVIDAGSLDGHGHMARFRCQRCGHESDWTVCLFSVAKRGMSCPGCNFDETDV
jgi:ribosomal protein S27E